MTDAFDPAALARAIQDLTEFAAAHAPRRPSALADQLEAHLAGAVGELPIVAEDYPLVERANLHLALDAWARAPGRSSTVIGLAAPSHGPFEAGLGQIVAPTRYVPPVEPGPRTYIDVAIGPRATLACLGPSLLLLDDAGRRAAAFVAQTPDFGMRSPHLRLEVMAADADAAGALLAEIRALAVEQNVYRGQVISLAGSGPMHPAAEVRVTFHERDPVARDAVILSPGVLDRIERHVLGMTAQADVLRAAGRDVKRGLLLHGPPGTGKTLTVRHLLASQPDRTAVLVAGADVGALSEACRLAHLLSPSTVVLEDVDLVAEERTLFGHGQNPVLAALLNEIDRVDGAADVVFILTTNRADLLEPALALRPGRIDQAVEIALPDAACRARLVALYGAGITLADADVAELVIRLDGVSAAFVKEVMRRAVVLAALAGHPPTAADVSAALDELLDDTATLTRSLLGAAAPHDDTDGAVVAGPFPGRFPIPVGIQHRLGFPGIAPDQ